MSEVGLRVVDVEVTHCTAVPSVAIELELSSPVPVKGVVLAMQLRIEAARRERAQWARGLLWGDLNASVPGFAGRTRLVVHAPCPLHLEQAAAHYLDSAGGGVPLTLHALATICRPGQEWEVESIPQSLETTFAMPAPMWRDALARHQLGRAVSLHSRGLSDRLHGYRARGGNATLQRALDSLLSGIGSQP